MRGPTDHEGEARAASATGPIRRVPSAADTTRVNSFPGSLTAYASHYSPYGSAFAAAAAQQAAVAAASDPPAGSDPQSVHHQQHPHRRPPLRQHSFDHRLVLQRQLHKQQQAYGMHCHAGRATGSCSDLRRLAHHTLNCVCGESAAARQQRPLQQQEQQQQQQGVCDTTFEAADGCSCHPRCGMSCAYQQQQQSHLYSSSRLGPMFSGPPSFGSEMATELAATTVANAGSFLRPQWTDGSSGPQDAATAAAAAAAAAATEAEARPRAFHEVPAHLTDAYAQHQFFRHLGNGLGFGTERRTAADGGSTGQHSQQQHLLQFVHEQQQHQHYHHHHQAVLLHRQLQGNHMPSLVPMMSAPPSTTLQAAAAVHPAAAARMYQIPAGLAAIRLRPQAAAVLHTAREAELAHSCRPVGFGTSDAAGAQAAAAGRDMVPGPQQLQLQQQGSDARHGLGCEQETALPYRQPQLRQQELQLLLQHQLRQLVPGAGSGAGAHSSSSAQGVEINLQDPAVLLELLRHSGMCKVPEEACALGWRCTWVKRLWIHMHTCRSGACTSVHCRLGKQVLPHYKECSDAACQMCQRVRGFDKALDELQALTARASSWAGESVDSQGTADNTPSTVYIAGEQDGAAPDDGAAVGMSPALSVTSKPVHAGAAQQQQQGHDRAHDDEEVEQGVLMRQQFFPETW